MLYCLSVKESFESCPSYGAIQLLQEKWVMHIVRALLEGPKGFNELGREIGGCNPTTLAQRLEKLEELNLLTKTVCSVMPPKSSYRLTDSGRALQNVMDAIHSWAQDYLLHSANQ